MTYLEWLEFCENQYRNALVPHIKDSKESFEINKAYWKGYQDAARDAARFVHTQK